MTDPNVPNGPSDEPKSSVPPVPPSEGSTPVPPPAPAQPTQPAPPAYGSQPQGAPQQNAPYGSQPPAAPYGSQQQNAPYGQQAYAGAPAQKSPVLSIIALVAGIIGVLTSFFYIGAVFGIAAVVLGFLGKSKEPKAKGMWLTGIILGFVAILLEIIAIILIVVALAAIGNAGYTTY